MELPGRAGDFARQENPWASLAASGSYIARPGHRAALGHSIAGHVSGSLARVFLPCSWVNQGSKAGEEGQLKSAADNEKFSLAGEVAA